MSLYVEPQALELKSSEGQGDEPGKQDSGKIPSGSAGTGGLKYSDNFASQSLLVCSEFLKFLSRGIVVVTSLQCLFLGIPWTSIP